VPTDVERHVRVRQKHLHGAPGGYSTTSNNSTVSSCATRRLVPVPRYVVGTCVCVKNTCREDTIGPATALYAIGPFF